MIQSGHQMDLVDLAHAKSRQWCDGVPEEVSRLFETLALRIAAQMQEAGLKPKSSADFILHRIRWEYWVERRQHAFVCNDHWTAPLARWFMARHPELQKFFELRERRR